MTAPKTTTAPDEALSSLMGAALGTPNTSRPASIPAPAYGSPADLALRIRDYIGRHGRENTATLLLYEAMNALRRPDPAAAGDARDAARYRNHRAALTSVDTTWLDKVTAALEAMGLDPDGTVLPTAEQVDAAFDAAIAAQRGKGGEA